jgi:eukaryotic-like serine/threonine-protein kinase
MSSTSSVDPELIGRLPLPLAQLYRRACNAKTAHERHLVGFYLWEAALKLLGSSAIACYACQPRHDPALVQRLQNLARPSLGHWWEFVRLLTATLADVGDPGFLGVRDLVLGKTRDDLPRLAGLDAALLETREGKTRAKTTVRLTELFDRLVGYRNSEIGHGAATSRPAAHHERLGRALLAGIPELLQRLDVLAGRRLIYVADVRMLPSGRWLVDRYELKGENAARISSLDLSDSEKTHRFRLFPERVYLDRSGPNPAEGEEPSPLVSLHPLLWHDFEAGETFFLNSSRGKTRIELLSYSTGRTLDRTDMASGQQELLGRLLDMPVAVEDLVSWAERSRAEEPAAPQPPTAPRRLGEFELLSELGRGGMGIVYRAWQPSLGRQVAVKRLFQVGDPRAEARFAREIRGLGRVEHPHVVKVFASGAEADQWFYAMELIEGATLAAVTERLQSSNTPPAGVDWRTWHQIVSTVCADARRSEKPLNTEAVAEAACAPPAAPAAEEGATVADSTWHGYVNQVVELVRQTAEGAHALHERGVLHRDVKPANIMVTADGSQAVLMDLGLAQLADEEAGKLTRTRQFVGTLRYASPEQVLAVGGLDRRTDVYSLGATLWELLTLRPMFGANESTPGPELMRRIQYEEVERPRRYHPHLARDLEAIVLKCLEKNPDKRYGTAHELAQDLDRYLHGEVVQARPVRGWERGWKWARRHPALAGLVLALVLGVAALAGGIVSTSLALGRAIAAEKQAEADKKQAEADRLIAQAVTAFLQKDVLGQADMGNQRLLGQFGPPGDPNLTVQEMLDRAAPAVEIQFKQQPLMEAEIRLAVGDAYRTLQQYAKAQSHLERSLALYRENLGEDNLALLGCKNDLAVLYHAQAKYNRVQANYGRAENLLREVLAQRETKLGADDLVTLSTRHNLAMVYYDQGIYDRTEPLLLAVLEGRSKKLGADHLDTLAVKNNLAMVYYDQGMLARSEALFLEVREGFKKKLDPEHTSILACKGNLADLFRDQEKYEVAEKLYLEVVKTQGRKLGLAHIDTLKNKRGLAWLYQYQEKNDRAEALLREVLAFREKALGAEHPDTLTDRYYLAWFLADTEKYEEAEKLYLEVLNLREKILGGEHPETLESKHNLAGFYNDRGQHDRAETLYLQALEGRVKTFGADHLYTLYTKSQLAGVRAAKGKHDEAETQYREMVEAQEKRWGAAHPWTIYRKNNLIAFYRNQKKYAQAEKLTRTVLEAQEKTWGADHFNTLQVKSQVAGDCAAQGRTDEAETLYREAAEAQEKRWGVDHPSTIDRKNNLIAFYRNQKKFTQAEPLLLAVLEVQQKKPGAEHADTMETRNNLAGLYQDMKQWDRAEALLAEQLLILQKQVKKDAPEEQKLTGVQSQLGMVRIELKKYAEAEKVLRGCLAIREKLQPDDWAFFNARSQLGAALAGQKKFEDAENLLLGGYEGMKAREEKIPPEDKPRLLEAIDFLVKLYEAQDKKDKAEEWRKKLPKND